MKKILTKNFRKFEHDYKFGDAFVKDKAFLKLERNLIRINPQRNYFSLKNNLNLPELPNGDYKSFLNGLLKKPDYVLSQKLKRAVLRFNI